ncbi:MAG: tRNA-intron lyase [Promethearchaeota archaeon]
MAFPYRGETLVPNPQSDPILEEGKWPATSIDSVLLGEKVVVFNPIHGAILYGYGRFFGIPVGIHKPKSHISSRPLELTLFEANFLLKRHHIRVLNQDAGDGEYLTETEFYSISCKKFPRFDDKYQIYEDLREKKYIPRPGQKFGADFVVYKQGPGIDHSSFCVQVLPKQAKISSVDVVRSARLATSVKKRFVLANPSTKYYFSFKWHKP